MVLLVAFAGCDDNNEFVLLSLNEEMQLGDEVKAEIEADPQTYPLLDPEDYSYAYQYLEDMKDDILSSDAITYKNDLYWELHIIQDDDVLNAFATPGGYIYVYTGLIKYLESADDLAGVLGHEIAHADRRHSAKQIQKQYGLSIITSIILGEDPSQLKEIVAGVTGQLAVLSFSRKAEAEADDYSVEYLSDTKYQCNGAASFFEKMLDENQTSTPEFLSTHPSPENRVEDINQKADEVGCSTTPSGSASYDDFKASLP